MAEFIYTMSVLWVMGILSAALMKSKKWNQFINYIFEEE